MEKDPFLNFISDLSEKIKISREHKQIMERVNTPGSVADESKASLENLILTIKEKIENTVSKETVEPLSSTEVSPVTSSFVKVVSEEENNFTEFVDKLKNILSKPKTELVKTDTVPVSSIPALSADKLPVDTKKYVTGLDKPVEKNIKTKKYVNELEKVKDNIQIEKEDTKVTEIKKLIEEYAEKYIKKAMVMAEYAGGGGTNAVQYAEGGTMNGDLNVNGNYLSGGVNLLDIFVTSETDSQTLSFNESNAQLSISNGNTVSLSALNDKEFISSNFVHLSGDTMTGALSAPALSADTVTAGLYYGVPGKIGIEGEYYNTPGRSGSLRMNGGDIDNSFSGPRNGGNSGSIDISGGSAGSDNGASGGSINLTGGDDGGGAGGSITMHGNGTNAAAGSINTSALNDGGGNGGSIYTSGGAQGPGGSINLSNGGGNITSIGGINGGGTGGSINLTGGSDTEGGNGGSIYMRGTPYHGNAGNIYLDASTNLGFGNVRGGNIDLRGYLDGGRGGDLTMRGYDGCRAGDINTSAGTSGGTPGGDITTRGDTYPGGSINTADGGGYISTQGRMSYTLNHFAGGYIDTSGVVIGPYEGRVGGSINTSGGGGSIDTRDKGKIEFGYDTTRTSLSGSATQNRTVYLPDGTGTLLLSSPFIAFTNQNTTFEQNVTIQGNLTALGTSTFQNTIFTTTSALSVINLGPGPALYVYQAAGPYDIASFYDGDGVEVLHVGNAQGGGNPLGQVGINTSFPSAELTVNGAISSNGIITVLDGNSDQWNSNYTTTNSNSASWSSVYNSYNSISGRYTTLDYLSSNFIYLSGVYVGPNPNSISATTPISAMSGMYVEPISGYAGFYTNAPIAPLDVRGTMKYAASAAATSSTSNIKIQGNYAYVTNYGDASLMSYDLTQTTPISTGKITTASYPQGLYINGKFAYVVTSDAASSVFQIFEILNPSSFKLLSTSTIGTIQNAFDVIVQGSYAFILTNAPSVNGYIIAYDISDPYAPECIFTTQTSSNQNSNGLTIQGKYLYWSRGYQGSAGVYRMDVSNPRSKPAAELFYFTGGTVNGAIVRGRYLYMNFNNVFGINNGTSTSFVSVPTGGVGTQTFSNIILQGNYAYYSNLAGLHKIDVSNPSSPKLVATIASYSGTNAWPCNFAIQGRYAYLADRANNRINVLDLGGAYIQQLQAGGLSTDTVDIIRNAVIGNDLDVAGGAAFGQGFKSYNDSSVQGSLTMTSTLSVGSSGNLFSPSFATFVKNSAYPTLSSTLTYNSDYFNSNGTFASPGGYIIKGHSPDYSTSIQNLPGYGVYGLWLQNVNNMDPGNTLISDGRAQVTHAMSFRAGINNFTAGSDHNHVQWQGAPSNNTQSWQMTNGGSNSVYGFTNNNNYTQRFLVHTLPQYQISTTIAATSGYFDTRGAVLKTGTDRLSGVIITVDSTAGAGNYNLITPGSVVGITLNPGLVGLVAVTYNSQCTQVSANNVGLSAFKFDLFIGNGSNWVPAYKGIQSINLKSRANGGNPGVSLVTSQIGDNPSTQYVGLTGYYRNMNKHVLARFTTASLLTGYKPGAPLTLWIPPDMPSSSLIGQDFITSDKISTFATGTFPTGVRVGYFDAYVVNVSGTDMEFALCNLMDSYGFENRTWPISAAGNAGWVLYGGTQDTVHRPTFGTTGFYFEREPWYFDGTNYLSGGMVKNVSLGNSESYGNYSYGLGFRGAVLGDKSGTFAGDYNTIYSNNSVALGGEGLISLSSTPYQAVVGKYNNPNNNALLVVGAGTTNTNRVNVLEVEASKVSINGTVSGKNVTASFNTAVATGLYSFAEGFGNASGNYSHAEGSNTTAIGHYSHAEGDRASALGESSHAEGQFTLASGYASHAQGQYTTSSGPYSHAEGQFTLASGYASHTEGQSTSATNAYCHAEGQLTLASGYASHTEGQSTSATNAYCHAEGQLTLASGYAGHAEGVGSVASGGSCHAEGNYTIATTNASHAEGDRTIASGYASHSEGILTRAVGEISHAAGGYSVAAHNRTWIWKGDTNTNTISTTRTDQFMVSAAGGVYIPGNVGIGTDANDQSLTVVGTISTNAHQTSQQWAAAYTNLTSNSAAYLSGADLSSIAAASGSWNSNYTTTNTNSAAWSNWSSVSASYALGSQYVKLSGDTMTGGLSTVALSTNDIYGTSSQSVFTDGSNLAGNGTGTLTLNYANGIFTSNNVTAALFQDTLGRSSTQWNSNYTTTNTNSGKWGSVYTSFNSNSAIYDSNWTTTNTNSASWGSGGGASTTLNSNSAKWDSNWTTTNTNSAKYDSVYTSFNSNSAKYDSVYTSFNSNSAKYDSNWTTTNSNSANWNSAYNYTSTYPLLTALKIPNINLGSSSYINAFTIPAGKIFMATGLAVIFDSGAFVNGTAGAIRLTKNSITNAANRIMSDLNIGIASFPLNSLLRRSSINDNNATGQPGDVIQIIMNGPTTAYTATVIVEGVLY